MELNELSESQQELLHPLLRLKTDVSLDSLVVLRDVFHDLSDAYANFAKAVKDTEHKLLTCYNIASSGTLTPQACEALLMVRGNTPNVSNVVLSATAEQSGVLSVMNSTLSFLNRVHGEARQLATSLDKSVVDPISAFSNEYLKTFGKDEKRAFRQDISGFIPKLQEFKRSPNYSHSNIRKYVDAVLKAHKEMQDCLAYETQLNDYVGSDGKPADSKLISKAKSRTVRAKVSLGNQIQELFTVAPELKDIVNFKSADVDTLSQISKVSKKQSESGKPALQTAGSHFTGTASEYQTNFCDLEMRRLELFSSCLQHWMDNHAKYEKGVYSQMEVLWKEVLNFSPTADYHKFQSYLTGRSVEPEVTHSRVWLLPDPGPIDDYTNLKLNSFPDSSTPMEVSEVEPDSLDDYDMYRDESDAMEQTLDSRDIATDLSNAIEPETLADPVNTIDNVKIVQLMTSPVMASPLGKSKPKHFPNMGKGGQAAPSRNLLSQVEMNQAVVEAASKPPTQPAQVPHYAPQDLAKPQDHRVSVSVPAPAEPPGESKRSFSQSSPAPESVKRGSQSSAFMPSDHDTPSTSLPKSTSKSGSVPVASVKNVQEPATARRSKPQYSFLNYEKGESGDPRDLLQSTRTRLDDHMLNLFNRCKSKNQGAKFDWLGEDIDDIVKVLEDYDMYPFTTDYPNLENFQRHSDIIVPMLRYSLFDKHMDERQWTLFSLEVLVLTHLYLSRFVNHPAIGEERGDLADFLLANLGVLDQTLIKFRKAIEAYRTRCGITDFEYAILELVLKPRDSFTDSTPAMTVHIMDVRYRILLMIDSFSKGEIAVNSEKLFVIPEFYHWMYRQLHLVHVALLQKLARVINLIPKHSKDLTDRWFSSLNSKTPEEDLRHGFHFDGDPKLSEMCNKVLRALFRSLAMVNGLREFAALKFTTRSYTEPLDSAKAQLLELLNTMVAVEDLDEDITDYFNQRSSRVGSARSKERGSGKSDKHEKPDEPIKEDDFVIDLRFYNDDDISVLADLRHRKALCFRQCIPRDYRTRPGRFIATKAAEKDLATNNQWNHYFNHRVDPVPLSKSWGMEEPVVLTVASCLHKYLSCDDIAFSELPQHLQTIVYLCSFMQTGILPNFNLLKDSVKNNENANFKNQIPLVAHSILAASAYWFSKIVNSDSAEPKHESAPVSKPSVEFVAENTDDFFKRLRLSGTGIRERLHSMINFKFKVTEDVAKQLYILMQMPTNVGYLPAGLQSLDSYLLFDLYKYKNGGSFTPDNLLPEYLYQDKSCIELITLENINELSKSVQTQMRTMKLQNPYNKVHLFLSQLLNYQIPALFTLDSEQEPWDFSLLTPSYTERTVSSVLYLRFISATFKNELFKCLCEYPKFVVETGLFYILSLFVMLFRALYPRLSDHIPNLSLFETDEENELYNMINIFRFIINKNAISFTTECIQSTRETNDVSLDENALVPIITDELLQMLRHQCTASCSIWNGFVQYAEFPSLMANCAILHLKNVYSRVKVNAGVLMPHLRRLMVFQRELDSSFIVRTPESDPAIQEQRLLNCMFFTYKNTNHRLNGYTEFIKMIQENLTHALEHKFVGIADIVEASIKRENWKSIGPDNLYSSGAVDLVTVLKFSLKASFDLSPPVEWLILPFTNACESAIRCYYNGVSNEYSLKLLYNIHSYLVEGEPALPGDQSKQDGVEKAAHKHDNGSAVSDDEGEKKSKKTLWKRLKHSIGGKSVKSSTHANFLAQLETYGKLFRGKTVGDDITRVANLNYTSSQLIRIPEEIFSFYYTQIRQRDPQFSYLHRAVGTHMVSDPDNFFFFEPQQLMKIPHSKTTSSLILASQRILKRYAKQSLMDVITLAMWKVVFVDFKYHIFYKLYTPNIQEGYRLENIMQSFPQTLYPLVDRMPEGYTQFAYSNFFEAFVKSVFYVIRSMKAHDFKFNKTNVKILYHDVDSVTRLLEKHAPDNLPLIENVKSFVRRLA